MLKKSLIRMPDSYSDKIKRYSLADGLLAILLFILYCFAMFVSGLIGNDVSKPFVKSFLKKQQALYVSDLKKALL